MSRRISVVLGDNARVLHAASPAALVPYAVHEQVRVLLFQRPLPPCVYVGADLPELVARGLRGHAVAPQQPAHVVDLTRGHTGQVHVDQRLLDAFADHPVQGGLQHGLVAPVESAAAWLRALVSDRGFLMSGD